jgi:CheY-like chemotaxis protein
MLTNKSDNGVANISKEQIHALLKISLKIMIVDDSERNLYLFEQILKHIASEKIIKAVDGIEAVELAKSHSDTDIIIMDIMMPRLDGVEATKEIRRFNKDVTIIAMRASGREGDIAKYKEVGFDAYITMPYSEEDILNVIFRLMH